MEKKIFSVADNISQSGGSVLQTMQNLPGVTVQDRKVQPRGNDKVTVMMDSKQTALTGFGNQTGLDNIPASAIDKIKIINNPSVLCSGKEKIFLILGNYPVTKAHPAGAGGITIILKSLEVT